MPVLSETERRARVTCMESLGGKRLSEWESPLTLTLSHREREPPSPCGRGVG